MTRRVLSTFDADVPVLLSRIFSNILSMVTEKLLELYLHLLF